MFPKLSLLLTLGFFLGLASTSPLGQETNAERLARGLPPNRPKFLRSGTPVLSSRSASTSPLPPVTLTGRLQVRSKDGHVLGQVRNWEGGGTIGGVNFLGPDSDLLVTLSYSPSDLTQLNILATNPAFPAPFYVGAGTFSTVTVPTLSASTRKYAFPPHADFPLLNDALQSLVSFTNVESTPPGSGPVKPAGRDAYVESAIWTIDPSTNKVEAQWINNDGSKPPTILAYDIRNNVLFFTGSLAAYNTDNPFPASAVAQCQFEVTCERPMF
ncbi:hypothetical protein NLJ89_g8053 [Agrocybe chaxingu]|uniref:Uncharacterized protein n=1 Tax=Agrocybe chaxingu TaxID=84603 RepID=A0A9W8K2H1_9AGAR|nr:hypothetical protein NLJ89_g8053 [Agrocybe chaxingu]